MKKLLTAILTVAMLLTVTACGQNASPVGTTPSATPVETPEATPTPDVTPTPVATPTPMATPTPTPVPMTNMEYEEIYSLNRMTGGQEEMEDLLLERMTGYSGSGLKSIPFKYEREGITAGRMDTGDGFGYPVNELLDADRTFFSSRVFNLDGIGYFMFTPEELLDKPSGQNKAHYVLFAVGYGTIRSGVREIVDIGYNDGTLTVTLGMVTSRMGADAVWGNVIVLKVDDYSIGYGSIDKVNIRLRYSDQMTPMPVNENTVIVEIEQGNSEVLEFAKSFIESDKVEEYGVDSVYYKYKNDNLYDIPSRLDALGSNGKRDEYFPISFSKKAYMFSAKEIYGENAPDDLHYLMIGYGNQVDAGDIDCSGFVYYEYDTGGCFLQIRFSAKIDKEWQNNSYSNVVMIKIEESVWAENLKSLSLVIWTPSDSYWKVY